MITFAENTIGTAPCDILLAQANRIYLDIETLYQNIQNGLVDATTTSVQRITERLNSLKEEARAADALIADSLRSLPYPPESTQALLARRNDILGKLYKTNQYLLTQAENIKVLVRHEIGSMAKNHNALKGYKPVDTGRKNIVRNSF